MENHKCFYWLIYKFCYSSSNCFLVNVEEYKAIFLFKTCLSFNLLLFFTVFYSVLHMRIL